MWKYFFTETSVWCEWRPGAVCSCTKKPVMKSDHLQLSSRRFISWRTTAQLKRVRGSFQGLPLLQAWPRVLDLAFLLAYFHISTFSLHHVSSRAFGSKTVREPNNSPQFLCVVSCGDKGASVISSCRYEDSFPSGSSPQTPAARNELLEPSRHFCRIVDPNILLWEKFVTGHHGQVISKIIRQCGHKTKTSTKREETKTYQFLTAPLMQTVCYQSDMSKQLFLPEYLLIHLKNI